MLRLRDIMTTNLVTVTPETTLREAVETLSAHHVSGAPVLDGARVAGVVSATDILAFTASTPAIPTSRAEPGEPEDAGEAGWEPGGEPAGEPQGRYYTDLWWAEGPDASSRFAEPNAPEWDVLAEHTVAEVMTRRVLALRPSEDVSAAAHRMRSADVHRVLVMEEGDLLGIVTTMDIARAVADHRITHRTYVFGRPATESSRDHRLF